MSSHSIESGPHAHSRFSVTETMGMVMICLAPATGMGFYQFGWPAILLFSVTVLSTLGFEAFCLLIAGRSLPRFCLDGSAVLTGWLLAMTLPPWAPWWVGTIGAFLAVVVGKHAYGGLGQNLFNPAMVARAGLLIALPVQMTFWVDPAPLGSALAPGFDAALAITFGGAPQVDALSGATVLGIISSETGSGRGLGDILPAVATPRDLFYGKMAGSLGETSAMLLLAGGLLLMAMRLISWRIPMSLLGAAAGLSGLLHLFDPGLFPSPLWHLTSGAMMLCAFFIATDYVTSPVSPRGQLIYGAGIGLLIVIIRTWGSYPEGAAFAVLLMNGCTPLIDEYTRPRIFGRTRRGKPLEIAERAPR